MSASTAPRRCGPGEQEALCTITAEQVQGVELTGGLDSLGHYVEADRVRQTDDCSDDSRPRQP